MTSPWRFSHLKAFGRSPAHGRFAREHDAKGTASMQRGTALHALIFGNREVLAYPGAVRRGKEYDAFVAEHPDAEIITQGDMAKIQPAADALRSDPVAGPLIAGTFEKTLLFKWNGLNCRVTPDILNAEASYVADLKFLKSADPNYVQWYALRMFYHAQLWFQHIGVAEHGYTIKDHYLIVLENAAPSPVTVFRMTDKLLDMGNRSLMLWAERAKTCEASKAFPGYTQTIVDLDAPEEAPELIFPDDETE